MLHYTVPNETEMKAFMEGTPDFMWPNLVPFMSVYEKALPPASCDFVLDMCLEEQPYNFGTCGAWTREVSIEPISLVQHFIDDANHKYFKYNIMPPTVGWMQEYNENDDYHLHMDGHPGQSRKLTGLLLLSDPETYSGGELWFQIGSVSWMAPNARGTVLVFPPWMLHKVSAVTAGIRHSLNVGVFGPPFK